jgi:hypothetical protein
VWKALLRSLVHLSRTFRQPSLLSCTFRHLAQALYRASLSEPGNYRWKSRLPCLPRHAAEFSLVRILHKYVTTSSINECGTDGSVVEDPG